MTKDTRCPLPFTQLLLAPGGKIAPCCWNQAYQIAVASGESLESLWNHPRLKALRREFLEGDYRTCASSIEHLGCNLRYEHLRPGVDWSLEQRRPPRRLDVRLNGECNLECVMCDVWKQPNQAYDSTFFWSEGPTKLFPFLEEILVYGGEPFVQKDTFRLLEEIPRLNASCRWAFTTNGQWHWSDEIQFALDRVEISHVNVSLDSVDEKTYARIRRKGKHALAVENIDRWIAYRNFRALDRKPFLLQISFLISRLNWREIPVMHEWCERRQVTPIFQVLKRPEPLALGGLPPREKKDALAKIREWGERFRSLTWIEWDEIW